MFLKVLFKQTGCIKAHNKSWIEENEERLKRKFEIGYIFEKAGKLNEFPRGQFLFFKLVKKILYLFFYEAWFFEKDYFEKKRKKILVHLWPNTSSKMWVGTMKLRHKKSSCKILVNLKCRLSGPSDSTFLKKSEAIIFFVLILIMTNCWRSLHFFKIKKK